MEAFHEIYKVGGAVRDRLLGIKVTDIDRVVVGATAEEMLAKGYKPVGADFPVFLDPKKRRRIRPRPYRAQEWPGTMAALCFTPARTSRWKKT